MEPLDYRNANFTDLKARLQGQRLKVREAWRKHGPGTTAEVALKAGISILTFRPRTTELYQLNCLILLNADHPGKEGIYGALSDAELMDAFKKRRTAASGLLVQASLDL